MLLLDCAMCGKEFRTFPSMVKKGNGKFCSRACYGRSITKPEGAKRFSRERICQQCGTVFFVYPARVRRGEAKFCSSRCYSKSFIASFPFRFWEKFDRSGDCWLWTGALAKKTGYGKVAVPTGDGPRHTNIHRVAWELTYGPIPQGVQVCHHCDVRHCGNPDHLFLGTQKQNLEDMVRKGRSLAGDLNPSITHADRLARGERHHQSKLTWKQVCEARRRHAEDGLGAAALARLCGIARSSMDSILRGKTWQSAM